MSKKTTEGDELVEEPENNGTASDLETDDVDSVESLDSEEEQTEEKNTDSFFTPSPATTITISEGLITVGGTTFGALFSLYLSARNFYDDIEVGLVFWVIIVMAAAGLLVGLYGKYRYEKYSNRYTDA